MLNTNARYIALFWQFEGLLFTHSHSHFLSRSTEVLMKNVICDKTEMQLPKKFEKLQKEHSFITIIRNHMMAKRYECYRTYIEAAANSGNFPELLFGENASNKICQWEHIGYSKQSELDADSGEDAKTVFRHPWWRGNLCFSHQPTVINSPYGPHGKPNNPVSKKGTRRMQKIL